MPQDFICAKKPVARHGTESNHLRRALDCKPPSFLNDRKIITKLLRPKRVFVGMSRNDGEPLFIFPLVDHTIACQEG